jgi:hypothetical protein
MSRATPNMNLAEKMPQRWIPVGDQLVSVHFDGEFVGSAVLFHCQYTAAVAKDVVEVCPVSLNHDISNLLLGNAGFRSGD